MKEHPFDDDKGVHWHLLDRGVDRGIGAVIEHPKADSTIAVGAERFQDVLDEGFKVVGVTKEPFRGLPTEAVPGDPRGEEVVLVHHDCGPSGNLDLSREVTSERRLSRAVNTIDCDHCWMTQCDDLSGELRTTALRTGAHKQIMPRARLACLTRS